MTPASMIVGAEPRCERAAMSMQPKPVSRRPGSMPKIRRGKGFRVMDVAGSFSVQAWPSRSPGLFRA